MRMDKLTTKFQQALADAQSLAVGGDNPYIEPVHVLASMFDMSRPAVSKHLAVLRTAGLVRETRSGRENLYALDRDKLVEAHAWLTAFWRSRLGSLKKLVEGKHGR